ncbi:MAG: hypothetical protein ACLQVI_37585 [Polyangiaceae bacterium]
MSEGLIETTFAAYWRKLEKVGWLDAVSQGERERIEFVLSSTFGPHTNPFSGERTEQRESAPVIEIYRSLGTVEFDCEDAFDDLKSLVNAFAAGSDGLFFPSDVRARRLGEERQSVSFRLGKKSFSWETTQSDWKDDGLLLILNDAVASSGVASRFHPLPALDQMMHVAIVPDGVFEAAVGEGLFNIGDEG